jgi:hypothetical protein
MSLLFYTDFLGLRVRACARFPYFASRIVNLSRHILAYNGQRTALVRLLVGAAGVRATDEELVAIHLFPESRQLWARNRKSHFVDWPAHFCGARRPSSQTRSIRQAVAGYLNQGTTRSQFSISLADRRSEVCRVRERYTGGPVRREGVPAFVAPRATLPNTAH